MSKKKKNMVKVEKDSKQFNAFGVVICFLVINVVICWIPVAGISFNGENSSSSQSIENLDSSSKNVEAPEEGSSVLSTSDIDLEALMNSDE